MLWYFGFISFHSRERGRELARLGDIQVQFAKANVQLAEITKVAHEMAAQTDTLDARRATLQRQVTQLERARDQIAISLQTASNAISPPATTWYNGLLQSLFTGVLGNLISVGLLALGTWFVGTRVWRFMRAWRPKQKGA